MLVSVTLMFINMFTPISLLLIVSLTTVAAVFVGILYWRNQTSFSVLVIWIILAIITASNYNITKTKERSIEVRKVNNEFDKGYNTLDSFRLDTINRKLDTLKIK